MLDDSIKRKISDLEVRKVAELLWQGNFDRRIDDIRKRKGVAEQRYSNEEWEGSPFEPLHSEMRGTARHARNDLAIDLIRAYLRLDLNLENLPPGRDYGSVGGSGGNIVLFEGMTIRVKYSAEKNGVYVFPPKNNDDFYAMILFGVSPFNACFWALPWQIAKMRKVDSKYFSIPVEDPPEWLKKYGGTFSQGLVSLAKLIVECLEPVVKEHEAKANESREKTEN